MNLFGNIVLKADGLTLTESGLQKLRETRVMTYDFARELGIEYAVPNRYDLIGRLIFGLPVYVVAGWTERMTLEVTAFHTNDQTVIRVAPQSGFVREYHFVAYDDFTIIRFRTVMHVMAPGIKIELWYIPCDLATSPILVPLNPKQGLGQEMGLTLQ